MKIFFYKTLLVSFVFFIVFKITIGSVISSFESKIHNLSSKENIEMIKEKIREEIKLQLIKKNLLMKKMLN